MGRDARHAGVRARLLAESISRNATGPGDHDRRASPPPPGPESHATVGQWPPCNSVATRSHPVRWTPLLNGWPSLLPARKQYGFDVLFAFVDESTNQFVWAVSHGGDFDVAEKTYLASSERAAVFDGVPRRVDESFVTKVNVVYQGWPAGG